MKLFLWVVCSPMFPGWTMHKIFSLPAILFFCSTLLHPQAQVNIALSATDSSRIVSLSAGLDLTATNCIDPQFGEYNIPIGPPLGYFDIRFDLGPYGCPGITTYIDYRPPGEPPAFPFTGLIVHTLWFQPSAAGLAIYLNYVIPAGASMTITDPSGGTYLSLGPFQGVGTAIIPASYPVFFNQALLKIYYDEIVPVTFSSFYNIVLQDERNVILNWTTATETNNNGFEVLRKTPIDGAWRKMGFVPGFGNSTEPKSYSFTDEDVETGTYFYKLKQIDFDGSFIFSNELKVEVDLTAKKFLLNQNYPNPFNPSTTISCSIPEYSKITIKVFNILGREIETLVDEEKPAGKYEIKWDAGDLPGGVYFYKLQAGIYLKTKKMILLR